MLLKKDREYNYVCNIYEVDEGGRHEAIVRTLKHTCPCRLTLKMSEDGGFAAKSDYIATIPYEIGVTPIIYVDDLFEITTPNELIEAKVDITAPLATEVGKLKVYLKRETWNTKPKSEDDGEG